MRAGQLILSMVSLRRDRKTVGRYQMGRLVTSRGGRYTADRNQSGHVQVRQGFGLFVLTNGQRKNSERRKEMLAIAKTRTRLGLGSDILNLGTFQAP